MHLSIGERAVEVCGRGGYPSAAASYEVGMRLMDIGDFFNEDCTRRGGKGLSQVNPTPGNKAGGLTTMTEKTWAASKLMGIAGFWESWTAGIPSLAREHGASTRPRALMTPMRPPRWP